MGGITILFSESPRAQYGSASPTSAARCTLFEDAAGDRLAVARVDANLGAAEVLHNRRERAATHYASAAERFRGTRRGQRIDHQSLEHDRLPAQPAAATAGRAGDERTRARAAARASSIRNGGSIWRSVHVEALLGVGRPHDALACCRRNSTGLVEPEHTFLASRTRELRAELRLGTRRRRRGARLRHARVPAQRPAHDFRHDEELALGILCARTDRQAARDDGDAIVGALARACATRSHPTSSRAGIA